MTDKNGRPLTVAMPGVPDPPYTYAPLFYPDTSDFQQAQSLKLNPGDEVAADFLLISAPVVSIRGKVSQRNHGPDTGKRNRGCFLDKLRGRRRHSGADFPGRII